MSEPSVESLLNRANAFLQAGQSAEGLLYAREALAAEPDSPTGHLVLGWLLLTTDEPETALSHFEIAAASRPDDAVVFQGLAQAYGQLGDVARARAAAARELELAPQSAGAHLRSARFALAGKTSKADKQWAQERIASALEIDPDNPSVLDTAARLSWDLRRFADADAFIARGLAIDPESSSLRYLYGLRQSAKVNEKSSVAAEVVQIQQMGQVLAADPRYEDANRLLLVRVWARVRALTALPLVVAAVLGPSMLLMYRPSSRYGIVWLPLSIIILLSLVAAIAALRVFRAVPRMYLRSQLRVAFRGWVLPAAIAGFVGAASATVMFGVVTSPTLARWSIVILSIGALCAGAAVAGQSVRLVIERERGESSKRRAAQARKAARSSLVSVLRVLVPLVVLLLVGLNTSHPDALAPLFIVVASWGAAALAPLWVAVVRARRERAVEREADAVPRMAMVTALIGIAVVGVGGVLGVVLTPLVPNDRDAEAAYVLTPPVNRESDDECTGTAASRLACRMDNLEDRLTMTPIPIPTFTFPEIDITIPDVTVPGGE